MRFLKRLFALLLLITGIVVSGISLFALSVHPQLLTALFAAVGAALVFLAWRLDRTAPADPAIFPLPEPAGVLEIPADRSALAFFALLAFIPAWSALFALAHRVDIPQAGWTAVLLGVPLAIWPFLRLFRAQFYLLINAKGIEHYRIGHIPWNDITGIRMASTSVKGQARFSLVIRVARPDRYLDRLSLKRHLLRTRKIIIFPLQVAKCKPLDVFEAATRFRGSAGSTFLTGWEGSPESLVVVRRWLAAHASQPLQPDQTTQHRQARVMALLSAAAGGWDHLDTPEMAADRLAALDLRKRVLDQTFLQVDREVEQAIKAGQFLTPEQLESMRRHAQAEANATSEGRTLQQLETSLGTRHAGRRKREMVWTGIAIAAFIAFRVAARMMR